MYFKVAHYGQISKLPSSTHIHRHGLPLTFFQGRAKFSWGAGAKTYYLPKKCHKVCYFLSKVKNYTILAAKGWGVGASDPSCPPLRTLMYTD